MIPHRIKLTGFLSYKDEQEVEFGAAPLWMLAGTNGSGKSSIFDAVTYALFGHHRGGSQNASELINKESNSMAVEFDFKLERNLFRIKRTLRRSAKGAISGTQQLFRHLSGNSNYEAGWEPVPDTGKKVDFDKWIHDKIGLNYETFTSSVLLLQGKAEKLLDARPSGRAEVLAGIVDLERYQRLHEKANTRKLELKSKLDALSHQQNAVPEVPDMEYLAAIVKIEDGEQVRDAARAKIDELMAVETQARRWAEAEGRLAATKLKLANAESLLGAAVKIEAEFARLRELREVLPTVNTVVTMKGQFAESERKTQKLQKDREEAQERKQRAEHALDQGKKKRAALQKQLATDEQKLAAVIARLRELTGLLEKVRFVEEHEAELKRLDDDLRRLPPDPEAAARAAHEETDRLTELNRILPILERFSVERHDLGVARKTETAARVEQQRVQADGERMKADAAKLKPEVEKAKQARAAADQQVAVTRAMAEQARAAAGEFASLSGEKACRACGQPLTKEHLAEEKKKREKEARAAEEKHRSAIDAQTTAVQAERDLIARETELTEKLDKLRETYRDQVAHVKQAAADIKRLADSLDLRYAEMPEPYRSRIAPAAVADWGTTAFPERDELVSLRRDAGGLDPAKRRWRETQDVLTKWTQLRAKVESGRTSLSRQKTALGTADPEALRREHQDKQAQEAGLVRDVKGAKQTLMQLETEIDIQGREAHTAVQHLTDIAGKLATEEVTRKHCTDTADRGKKGLPPAWQAAVEQAGMGQYHEWKIECDTIAAAGTEAKYKQLEVARAGLTTLRQEITDLAAAAEAFPPETRRAPDEVKLLLAGARTAFDERDKEWRDAQRQKAVLDGYREQRAKLGEQWTRTDGEHNRYKTLAELLGRDRLQRHLVRQAERQIVDYANAVLDRLSGGQLFLRLVGGDDGAGTDRALELEAYNRVTGGAPINVAFLSGSQRFRVAVSLALGIGQYASRQHRPIESVIIDEGFGCLDRQGRQVMIQELQNLRGHLQCILLVSHQEEFADAFPDGYRFELNEGSTRVSRFQR
ncbi:AAA family ATPase [Fimbriiglobus ruber]|uniref:DNA double-strand break repair Rad50 ATPase n=1 Tax=Fimbriiglobus ruber TaxID=1908690 RepID=A0A225EDM6_9BACT|nr:SMC family ATPase [Fimbriiglobus ruber]OWK47409.1 DNA double-strand break repair Rad50 ATPase [Fimbriiglobus ruber]